MESNYNNDSFERFLRESSEQYRMYPSENVWKRVYNALHTRRRWFGIGLILLLSAGFVTTIMVMSPIPENKVLVNQKDNNVDRKEAAETKQPEKILLAPYTSDLSSGKDPLLQDINLPDYNKETDNLPDIVATPLNDLLVEKLPVAQDITVSAPGILMDDDHVALENETGTPIPMTISDEATDQSSWFLADIHSLTRANTNAVKTSTANYRLNSVNYPLSIESVINSYRRRNKKLSFQFYFTPTISYRKLSENKAYLRSLPSNSRPGNYAVLYNNINNVVTHKPDMGVELGATARYTIGKRLKIRGGLQFNTSRYDIKAFSYSAEMTTISLNTGTYTDSVNTISSYRNFNGYRSDWLHNFYFQLSAPIGLEFKLVGDDKVQFGIASTIQPTYILGDRAYILSSNYKNYAEVPWLTRHWNVNASFETFVAYSTGKMNWQIGPQVRYQLQSSFIKEYPVKENLFDFGLKIGVSANK